MSDPQDPPRPPRAGPDDGDGLDAPVPTRLIAERSGSWKAARARHHPAVASLGLESNLRAYQVDSDTEETPPTAAPGMFRFDDLDDADAPPPAPAPAPAPMTPHDDEDDGLAALQAAIAAERAAVQGDVAPAPVADVLDDGVGEPPAIPAVPSGAPAVAPAAAVPAARGVPWLPVLVGLAVVAGLAAWLLGALG